MRLQSAPMSPLSWPEPAEALLKLLAVRVLDCSRLPSVHQQYPDTDVLEGRMPLVHKRHDAPSLPARPARALVHEQQLVVVLARVHGVPHATLELAVLLLADEPTEATPALAESSTGRGLEQMELVDLVMVGMMMA